MLSNTYKRLPKIAIFCGIFVLHLVYLIYRVIDSTLTKEEDFHPDNHGTHGRQTGKMLKRIEEIFLKGVQKLLVFGNTNNIWPGAVEAVKMNIPIAQLEVIGRLF